MKDFDFKDFYDFFNSLTLKQKRLLRKKILNETRCTENTVRGWVYLKKIPYDRANAVHKSLLDLSDIFYLNKNSITEKKLFPQFADFY